MSVLTFPTLASGGPSEFFFRLVPNTQTTRSPLDRAAVTKELPGAVWKMKSVWDGIPGADARLTRAFLAQLRGAAGRFYMYDMAHPVPSGTALGTGRVSGAGQSGATLVTSGWAANQAGLLLPGDNIGVNGELKIITGQVASDSSGVATLVFEPPLRSSPADTTIIVTNRPTCIMMLDDDAQDTITFAGPMTASPVINATECFS